MGRGTRDRARGYTAVNGARTEAGMDIQKKAAEGEWDVVDDDDDADFDVIRWCFVMVLCSHSK